MSSLSNCLAIMYMVMYSKVNFSLPHLVSYGFLFYLMSRAVSTKRRGVFPQGAAGGASVFIAKPVRKAVRKSNVIVAENLLVNVVVGVGTNIATTTLFRCGQVMTNTGAPTGNIVTDSCTMVRFIFNGGFVCSNIINATISVTTLFIVVARVEALSSLIQILRTADNEFLTSNMAENENIFYSGAFPLMTRANDGSSAVTVPISIDMKAKRKMNTGDTITMFAYTAQLVGSTNQDIALTGVSTVIAI